MSSLYHWLQVVKIMNNITLTPYLIRFHNSRCIWAVVSFRLDAAQKYSIKPDWDSFHNYSLKRNIIEI